ncbi:hypothetical protein AMJ86_04875 [bacterium SM23_57]|nr:MAG: hypothetical protein AMJ86_04875 [bacterium SM23_57]
MKSGFKWLLLVLLVWGSSVWGAGDLFTVARLKYAGGGDWYSNPSSLPNLLGFVREKTSILTEEREAVVEILSPDLFRYPYLYMNGHGTVKFSDDEVVRLREYFEQGGFLHADDNYGMDKTFRKEILRVFPESRWVELPFSHPIYHSQYDFPHGLPKIHEHDGKPPQGLGLFLGDRLCVFYTYECDLGDGWEDADVHNDPVEKRMAALKMGANIMVWRLRNP